MHRVGNYLTNENINNPKASKAAPPIIAISVTQCPRYCLKKAIKTFTRPTPIDSEPIKPDMPPIAPSTLPFWVVGSKALSGAMHK